MHTHEETSMKIVITLNRNNDKIVRPDGTIDRGSVAKYLPFLRQLLSLPLLATFLPAYGIHRGARAFLCRVRGRAEQSGTFLEIDYEGPEQRQQWECYRRQHGRHLNNR